MTAIGERGINLSGGQKSRVGLARAMYSTKAKLLLLDDPLSAVDGHVGDHLFSDAICGKLSKESTKILVTHHVQFLPRCDAVIVLEDGEIKHYGRYEELVDVGVDFHTAVDVSDETSEEEEDSDDAQDENTTRRRKKKTRDAANSEDVSPNEEAGTSSRRNEYVHTADSRNM